MIRSTICIANNIRSTYLGSAKEATRAARAAGTESSTSTTHFISLKKRYERRKKCLNQYENQRLLVICPLLFLASNVCETDAPQPFSSVSLAGTTVERKERGDAGDVREAFWFPLSEASSRVLLFLFELVGPNYKIPSLYRILLLQRIGSVLFVVYNDFLKENIKNTLVENNGG